MTAYDRFVTALEQAGCRKGAGNDWTCPVPAHDDRRPSLGVTAANGCVLIRCGAGCETIEVVSALGLTMRDLFDTPKMSESQSARIVETYDYTDELGALLLQVVRFAPKSFRQRRPDGRGGWTWNLNGTRRVPYRLPEVIEALGVGRPVHIVEGEKDVAAIEDAGSTATCAPGGAGAWKDEYSALFVDSESTIRIIADRDQAGIDHARKVQGSLGRAGVSAEIMMTPLGHRGADAADHFASALGLDDFVPLDHQNNASSPSFDRIVLIGDAIRERAMAPESDSPLPGWLDPDPSLGMVIGKNQVAKTTMAINLGLAWATDSQPWDGAEFASPGGLVLILSNEQPARKIIRRCWWMTGQTQQQPGLCLRYPDWEVRVAIFGKDSPEMRQLHTLDAAGIKALGQLCDMAEDQHGEPIKLVILDSLGRLKPPGLEENSASEMVPWLDSLLTFSIQRGAWQLLVHHQGHDGGGRASNQSGRGSTAIGDVSTTQWTIRRDGDFHREIQLDGNDITPRSVRFRVTEDDRPGEVHFWRPEEADGGTPGGVVDDVREYVAPGETVTQNELGWRIRSIPPEQRPSGSGPGSQAVKRAAAAIQHGERMSWGTVGDGPRNSKVFRRSEEGP